MDELTEKDIKKNQFLWYGGEMALSSWSCPAVITRIDPQKRTFRVMSLDDMHEQDQVYDFDISEHSPSSRKRMQLISADEVREYLSKRECKIENQVRDAQEAADKAKRTLERFRKKKEELLTLSKT